jgi:hypothetical protein
MRWLDATPRRAAPKGHETFISRAVMTSVIASYSGDSFPRTRRKMPFSLF